MSAALWDFLMSQRTALKSSRSHQTFKAFSQIHMGELYHSFFPPTYHFIYLFFILQTALHYLSNPSSKSITLDVPRGAVLRVITGGTAALLTELHKLP